MHRLLRIVLLALFFSLGFESLFSQKSSPFKNPNSQLRQRSLPKPNFSPPNLVQKPNKQLDHSGEVAFRGYFYLNGKPRFCLYNIKANFSEWISLGSSTYEEFTAVAFHEESETLTVAYKNHPEFNLNLYGPSNAPLWQFSFGLPTCSDSRKDTCQNEWATQSYASGSEFQAASASIGGKLRTAIWKLSSIFEHRCTVFLISLWHKGSVSRWFPCFSRTRIPRCPLRSAGSCPDGSRFVVQSAFFNTRHIGTFDLDSRVQSCFR